MRTMTFPFVGFTNGTVVCQYAWRFDPARMPFRASNYFPYDVALLLAVSRPANASGMLGPHFGCGQVGQCIFSRVLSIQLLTQQRPHWKTLWAQHPDIKALKDPFSPYAVDFWSPEPIMNFTDSALTQDGTRTADDLILSNVISFDIRVWDAGYPILQDTNTGQVLKPSDPGYKLPEINSNYNVNLPIAVLGFGGYVDLGYYQTYDYTGWKTKPLPCPPPPPNFNTYGNISSPLCGSAVTPRVYDTWCNTYDGTLATDGFDNNSMGIVDNNGERAFVTPYSAPLRGIQVIIRIFEPDSRQIREVTITQDFLPK